MSLINRKHVEYLTRVPAKHLDSIARYSGYSDCKYKTSKFVGLSTSGQWVYKVTFVENGEVHDGKVFLKYDPVADRITLDF